ncbi:MAG: galactokinase [Acidobacteria bacterium 13_1_40CM_4_58_4]|nr:MAG: galactokinase [Acidobacteria bacterium 13_1_40CM_4_58_4]
MIVTRTPFRVTLGGGGTDLPSYYEKYGGFIFAMGIDKYMYVMTNPPTIDNKIRLHYSQSETVDHVNELRHELARGALKLHGIEDKMEISSMADLPAGTGVGSSSCYLVGLLTALHHYRREHVSLQTLAEEACHIELNILKKSIGKQDQYMAAYGGLTVLEIGTDGKVKVRSVELGSSSIAALVANTHIYYTGLRRNTLEVLTDQNEAMKSKEEPGYTHVAESLHRIKDLGYRILDAIEREDFDAWGQMLDEHWQYKKRMSSKISLPVVDRLYDEVRTSYGVLGGKIVGAGGGGFLMLYCPNQHRRLEQFMLSQGMPRLHYMIEPEGSKVVANIASTKAMTFHPKSLPSEERVK